MSTQNSSLIRANIHLINYFFRLSSSKRPEKLKMPDRIKSQDMHSGLKGELIENELYQSADNVIDCKNNMDTVCDILEDSSCTFQRENTNTTWNRGSILVPVKVNKAIQNQKLRKKTLKTKTAIFDICQYKIVTMTFFNVQIILREDKPATCTCNIIAF